MPDLVYLDNSATTRVAPEVVEAVVPAFRGRFANPSSVHRPGVKAHRALERARARVALALGVDPAEVVLCSGGTEAQNLAVLGAVRARRRERDHVVTTRAEHPAVAGPVRALEEEGVRVTRLPIDRWGRVDPADVVDALTDRTALVSIIHVGNELGGVNPIGEIARRVKGVDPEVLVHSDGVQAFGKVVVELGAGVDLYGISGHKIHAPKGIGALRVARGTRIEPLIHGGGHEGGRRSGTENVPGAIGLGVAAEKAASVRREEMERLRGLRDRMAEDLEELGAAIQSPPDGVATILSVAFPGEKATHLLHGLEERGVACSAGAACASKKTRRSPVLEAAGLPDEAIDGTLRISLSRENTAEEIDRAMEAFREVVGVPSR